MKRTDLVLRVRSMTRDLSNSIFREQDIIDYINESIDRFRQYIPELNGMTYLTDKDQEPVLLPQAYQHLLSVYSSSRCFSQDERHYQATTLMNEFETKMEDLKSRIEGGVVVITDPTTGLPVTATYEPDYVKDNYFTKKSGTIDADKGVEGVPS